MEDFEDDDVAIEYLKAVANYFNWKIVRVNDLEDDSVIAGFVLGEAEFCASIITMDKAREEMI